jgi:8-oxo-dGTP diphosphatase
VAVLNESGEVRAAGGVAWRRRGAGLEVLLVHRGEYDDWTLPKGKVEDGETDEACALREVEEETGLRCRLLTELPSTRWTDRLGRPKVSRYWLLASPDGGNDGEPRNEVDEVAWLPIDQAIERLSYARDEVVLRAVAVALTPPGQTAGR